MDHLTDEERHLVEPLLNKYYAIAIAAGDTLAKVMSTQKHAKDVGKMGAAINAVFIAGAAAGYFMDITWLLYLSLLFLFSYGTSLYAYDRIMREKIERLFDKVDILMIDWITEFGDDKHIQETIPKAHIEEAGAGYWFNTTTKEFKRWWSYHRREVYRRVLGRARAAELCELELADIEKTWGQ